MDCPSVGWDLSWTVQLWGWIYHGLSICRVGFIIDCTAVGLDYHGLYSCRVGFIMDCTAVGLDLSWTVQL